MVGPGFVEEISVGEFKGLWFTDIDYSELQPSSWLFRPRLEVQVFREIRDPDGPVTSETKK